MPLDAVPYTNRKRMRDPDGHGHTRHWIASLPALSQRETARQGPLRHESDSVCQRRKRLTLARMRASFPVPQPKMPDARRCRVIPHVTGEKPCEFNDGKYFHPQRENGLILGA